MAHTTTHTPASASLFDGITRVFNGVFMFLVQLGESSAKARQINALMEMTDSELAARGLKREDIARHVFQAYYV